jgi:hypothetical protein
VASKSLHSESQVFQAAAVMLWAPQVQVRREWHAAEGEGH